MFLFVALYAVALVSVLVQFIIDPSWTKNANYYLAYSHFAFFVTAFYAANLKRWDIMALMSLVGSISFTYHTGLETWREFDLWMSMFAILYVVGSLYLEHGLAAIIAATYAAWSVWMSNGEDYMVAIGAGVLFIVSPWWTYDWRDAVGAVCSIGGAYAAFRYGSVASHSMWHYGCALAVAFVITMARKSPHVLGTL